MDMQMRYNKVQGGFDLVSIAKGSSSNTKHYIHLVEMSDFASEETVDKYFALHPES